MKRKKLAIITTALMLAAGSVGAATDIWDNPKEWSTGLYTTPTNCIWYNPRELSLDLFGSYINPESRLPKLFDSNIRRGAWGGGAGVNYFFCEYLGIGGDVNLSAHPGSIVDQAVWSVILRYPIEHTPIAPYLIGSGGRSISPEWAWIYGGGPGLEVRITKALGLFGEARYFWTDSNTMRDRLILRTGLRIVF
jgi:hypothetical protein